jgi:hypothetical protein
MIAQPRVRKAWWMSARISQRIRSRRNQRIEGCFDDPAVLAQAASVLGAAPGDERTDAQLTDLAAVDVVVVTAVGVEDVGASPPTVSRNAPGSVTGRR